MKGTEMAFKIVEHRACPCGSKRGFASEQLAEKALGRAQAKRNRAADKAGTRRGMHIESRYFECSEGMLHLTSQSKRSYNEMLVSA